MAIAIATTIGMGTGRVGRRALRTLVLVGLLVSAAGAPADVLETRDGQTRNGSFRGATQEVLKFETPDGNLHLVPLSQVETLRFGATPATARAEPSADEAPAPEPAEAPAPATPPAAAEPAQSAPASQRVVLPAGSRLRVRIADTLDPRRSTEGDRFAALLESPVAVGDLVLAPARSRVYGVVAAASTTGPLVNRLQLELTDLQIQGRRVPVVTGTHQPVAPEAGGADAPADAAPAAPRDARIPSGTLLEFRLLQPLEMQVVR